MSPDLQIFGQHDPVTIAQMQTCLRVGSVAGGVLCADGHLGYAQPVGGVVAYESDISISGVGFDIACGNMAVRLDTPYSAVKDKAGRIAKDVSRTISFGIGRRNAERVEHVLFDSPLWEEAGIAHLKKMAAEQLGTVGAGNHYVDLFEDEQGFVWIGVHFGSRGLGHRTATQFLKLAGGRDGMMVEPTVIPVESELGQRYLAGMELAGLYAYAGREWVVERVRRIVGGAVTNAVPNHHNYAWRETHGGRDLWVVRKGATPAFPGQTGFVGGSMGDDAVIIEGIDSELSREALFSTIHGAGRIMSRTQAKGKFVRIGNKRIRQDGLVRHDEMMKWLKDRTVTLRGGDLDEAPQAYRRLPEVLAAHAGTIRVLHTLRPLGVAMAGHDIVDPYKD